MGKRKVTVTVDESIVEQVRLLGDDNLSALVNAALGAHVERLARRAALGDLLDSWDEQLGPVPTAEADAARAAFDELDGHTSTRASA